MATQGKKKKSRDVSQRGASQWAVAWRRFKKHKAGMVGLGMIIALLVIAAFHESLAPYPQRPLPGSFEPLYAGEAGQPPTWKHPFGTTIMGTDVFSDVIHGTVYTVLVAGLTTVIVMFLTITVGIAAGYLGLYVDDVLMRITEVFLVFPSTLLILVFARIFQLRVVEPTINILGINIPTGLTIIILVVALFGWAGNARIIRGEALRLKKMEYIEASRSLGASSTWIMFRHILPNVLPQIIVLATLTMASAVLIEAGVSFLGFGDPNTVTWGRLLQESFNDISTTWWAEIFPGLAVFVTVLAFNLVGDGLSDAMNPRLRE
ncbi:MAG TPA: ABC transporter permease [Candidatus Bathyarchaeia archaeon]|nr:ABC transporter permease [Candidatus Bathyarchaeia archaeon]